MPASPVRIKSLDDNECAIFACVQCTTEDGLLCPRHWDMISTEAKSQYIQAKRQAMLDVRAYEEVRR